MKELVSALHAAGKEARATFHLGHIVIPNVEREVWFVPHKLAEMGDTEFEAALREEHPALAVAYNRDFGETKSRFDKSKIKEIETLAKTYGFSVNARDHDIGVKNKTATPKSFQAFLRAVRKAVR